MKNAFYLALILIASISNTGSGQRVLSLEESIRTGIENNYYIRISKNNETIAANSNTRGNAGFLPTISTSGNLTYNRNNISQKYFSGDERTAPGAGNTAARLAAEMNWTAFDGFKMHAVKERLETQEEQSRAFTKKEMQDLATQIQQAYYGIVRIRQQIDISYESIQLNRALRNLALEKLRIGTTTQLEVLQTTNRVNTDSSALLNQLDRLQQAKIALNRLMGQRPDFAFTVNPDITREVLPPLSRLNQMAIEQNQDLKLLRYDEKIALAQIKEARSNLFPTLNLNAGFNYNYSKAEVGFLLSNRTFGPSIGISANYDIFQGRNLKKDIENAELFKENTLLSSNNLKEDILSEMAVLYQQYIALLDLLNLEQKNVETAEQNTRLADQLFRLGRATAFEVREAIVAETQVKDRLSDVQYRLKITEIEIKSLAGIPMFNVNN